jgi:chemotaxis protein MotB
MNEPFETDLRKPSRLPWVIVAVAVALAVAILAVGWLPARSESSKLGQRVKQLSTQAEKQQSDLRARQQEVDQLKASSSELQRKLDSTKGELNAAIQEREALKTELREAQRDLSETLGKEIAAGDVLIQERRGELVVDVSDRLLFDEGQTEVSDAGKELLRQVAKSIKRLPPKLRFQVGGHTDSKRVVSPELVERYPTNWELSTARACNVVRYLQETGKVPGRQLIAAGFAQYRPASTNNTKAGRKKNRRIEIVVVLPKD